MNFWWKFASIAAMLGLYGIGVWQVRGWYESSKIAKSEAKQITSLGAGAASIIQFDQQWAKDRQKDPDPCALGTDAERLLR